MVKVGKIRRKKGRILAAVGAILVAIAAIIPTVAYYVFTALGAIFVAIGTGFGLIATWLAKTSDEPHERAIWAGILLFLVIAYMIYFGLPLLSYLPAILFFAFIFLIAVLVAMKKTGRRRL